MTARERKRTEKTRYETRRMRLDVFMHANGSSYWERATDGLLTGAQFRVVVNSQWGFDKPDGMSVVMFMTKLTETGLLPDNLPYYKIGREQWRYVWPDGQKMQSLGKVTFDYQVNEWNELHNPGMAHPWKARSWDDRGIGYHLMWEFEEQATRSAWIKKLFRKFTKSMLQARVTEHDAKLVMKRLTAVSLID